MPDIKDIEKRRERCRAYYNLHKIDILAKKKNSTPEQREMKRAYQKVWRCKNTDIQEEWRKKNKDKVNKYKETYNQKYPERVIAQRKAWSKRYTKTLNSKICVYKTNAKKRGILFELTEHDFKELWQKPCFYCGDKIETIGLDRVDNSTGYIKSNIVPCCRRCNSSKMDASKNDFIDHCKRILRHLNETL